MLIHPCAVTCHHRLKILVDCKCKFLCYLLLCLLVVVDVICADFAVFEQLQGSVNSLLQTVAKDEDMSWARREQQALGTVPSRGGGEAVYKLLKVEI